MRQYVDRQRNAQLRAGDRWAENDDWLEIVEQAMERLSVVGLARPAELPANGEYTLNYYMVASSGLVKWTLRYACGRSWVIIGGFMTDYLPDRQCAARQHPVRTHGQLLNVTAGQRQSQNMRQVRVLVDAEGLPVPIPVEVWNAMGL